MAVLALVLASAGEQQQAAAIERDLDARIAELSGEVREAIDAELRLADLRAEVDRVQVEKSDGPGARAVPCEADEPEPVAAIAAVLGLATTSGIRPSSPRRRDFYTELPFMLTIPSDALGEVAAACARSERLLYFVDTGPNSPGIVAFQYRCNEIACAPTLATHDPIPNGSGVAWPLDRGIRRRMTTMARLVQDRDRHAEALLLVKRKRCLADEIARRQGIVDELMRRRPGG